MNVYFKDPKNNKKSENQIDENQMSISECAEKNNRSRQAIFRAITMKRIRAKKNGGQWVINQNDFEEYEKSKHSRKFSMRDGKPLYTDEIISPPKLAEICNVDLNRIYFMLRKNVIPHERHRTAYLINKNEAMKIKKLILEYKPHPTKKNVKSK